MTPLTNGATPLRDVAVTHEDFRKLAADMAGMDARIEAFSQMSQQSAIAQRQRDEDHRKSVAEALNRMQAEFDRLGGRFERAEERTAAALREAMRPIMDQIVSMQSQMLVLQQQSASRSGQERMVGAVAAAMVSAIVAAIVAYLSGRGG